MTRILGIVPARGGSKRIPNKNIREIDGKPLIAHTLKQAADATRLDRTIVSTEDDEIAGIARDYGGKVPFSRPDELATDTAATSDVITHALDWHEERGERFEVICLLQVTSPLRTAADIDDALATLTDSEAASVVSVTPYTQEPQFALRRTDDRTLEEVYDPPILFGDEYVREQDLEEHLFPNGAIYAASVDAWRDGETFFTQDTAGYLMPPERSLEIDVPWELELVRAYLERTP